MTFETLFALERRERPSLVAVMATQTNAMANAVGASVLALGGMVPSFTGDGSGIPITDFLNILEQVGNMGAWTDEQLIGVARCKMVGTAYSFAWHEESMQKINKFSEFKKLAVARFDIEPHHVKLDKFHSARQNRNEDVRAFATRVRKLGYDTLSTYEGGTCEAQGLAKELLEMQLRTQFLNGLRDPVRRFALSHDPKTFEEAIEVAAREEKNERLVNEQIDVRPVSVEDKEKADMLKRLERLEDLLAKTLTLAEQREERDRARVVGRRRGSQAVCFNCGQRGHFARNCPARGNERIGNSQGRTEPVDGREGRGNRGGQTDPGN